MFLLTASGNGTDYFQTLPNSIKSQNCLSPTFSYLYKFYVNVSGITTFISRSNRSLLSSSKGLLTSSRTDNYLSTFLWKFICTNSEKPWSLTFSNSFNNSGITYLSSHFSYMSVPCKCFNTGKEFRFLFSIHEIRWLFHKIHHSHHRKANCTS